MFDEKETFMQSRQKEKKTQPKKGKILPAEEGIHKALIGFLKKSLENQL